MFVFGDHVNTDEIIAARYLNISDWRELAGYLMEDIRPGFGRRGDLIGAVMIAGENFGCGSSREHAPRAIKEAGISAVIARSFARIFLRNALNIGLPVIRMSPLESLSESDEVKIDIERGRVLDVTRNREYCFDPFPEFLRLIMECGGWLSYARSLAGSVRFANENLRAKLDKNITK